MTLQRLAAAAAAAAVDAAVDDLNMMDVTMRKVHLVSCVTKQLHERNAEFTINASGSTTQ